MDFIPEQPNTEPREVPFYDDVTTEGGWQGHTTSKSIESLKSDIIAVIGHLGGLVVGFQRGTFVIGSQKREGFQIHYTIERPDGALFRGRLDVAALPVKDEYRRRRSLETRRLKSLKMALYMTRQALDGTWFLQQLSPGYAPLMPWMLTNESGDKTIGQLWTENAFTNKLLPPGDSEFVEGEFNVEVTS